MPIWEKGLRGLQNNPTLDFMPIIWKFNESGVLEQGILKLLRGPGDPKLLSESLLVLKSKA